MGIALEIPLLEEALVQTKKGNMPSGHVGKNNTTKGKAMNIKTLIYSVCALSLTSPLLELNASSDAVNQASKNASGAVQNSAKKSLEVQDEVQEVQDDAQ